MVRRISILSDQSVYVMGHKNPDTDAICSALGYADFLRRTTLPEARAACCGELNVRTEWVLEQAGIPAPPLVLDVRPTAASVSHTGIVTAQPGETFLGVYQRMRDHGYRSMPVVDGENKLVGMVTLLDLLQLLLPSRDVADRIRSVKSCLDNMREVLKADEVLAPERPREELEFILFVAASSEAVIAHRLQQHPAQRLLFIVGDRPQAQKIAIDTGVAAIILTRNAPVSDELVARAQAKGTAILRSALDTASAVQLIRSSRSIDGAVTKNPLTFHGADLVRQIQESVAESAQSLFPVLEEETGKLLSVLSKSDLISPPRTRLVLVDHNEFSQAVSGADEAEIIEIIDHHRLSGDLVTREPVRFINEPVGSTSTIVARYFQIAGLVPMRGIAVCLCGGIISDTLKLTSPTTTNTDREMLQWLSQSAKLDIDAFAQGFFAAGSALEGRSTVEALNADRKEYEENGWRISISQIEELGLNNFWHRREELHKELEKLVTTTSLDFACLMITDITRHYSLLLTAGDARVIERIEYPVMEKQLFEMEGVVSRKKQLFPMLSRVLTLVAK